MNEPSLWQHALAVVVTMAVVFVLKVVQDGVKDALMLIGFTAVCLILFFGSMPYAPPRN